MQLTKVGMTVGAAIAALLTGFAFLFVAGWTESVGVHCREGSDAWNHWQQNGKEYATCADYFHFQYSMYFFWVGTGLSFVALLLGLIAFRVHSTGQDEAFVALDSPTRR
jgi:hypothetical protein